MTEGLRELRAEVKELQEIRNRLRDEAKQLESTNKNLNIARLAMLESLAIEAIDLLGRLARISTRVKCLGFDPTTVYKHYARLDAKEAERD